MVYNDRKVKVIYISNNVSLQDSRTDTSATKSKISIRNKFPEMGYNSIHYSLQGI